MNRVSQRKKIQPGRVDRVSLVAPPGLFAISFVQNVICVLGVTGPEGYDSIPRLTMTSPELLVLKVIEEP